MTLDDSEPLRPSKSGDELPISLALTGAPHSRTVSQLAFPRGVVPSNDADRDFRSIYREHVDFVWRYAATHGIERASLDDVVQEVFMVVHGRLATFEQRSSLKTWIAGIAVNVVRGFRRRRGAQRIGDPLSDEQELPAEQASASDTLELKRSLELLDATLARMTELQREAFVLCELEQFSQVEVASLLGVNENTLRTRLRAARSIVNDSVEHGRAGRGVR